MNRDTEKVHLQRLLEAIDAQAPSTAELVAERPREGLLLGALARAELGDAEACLVLAALAARLAGRTSLTGAELAQRAWRGSAERLVALGLLTTEGRLLARGCLVADVPPPDGATAETASYRLSPELFRAACEVFGSEPARAASRPSGPYRTNSELLADLRRLSLLYRRRAGRVFQLDPFAAAGPCLVEEPFETLRAETARVASRLAATPASANLPLAQLRARHGLDLDALVVLVTLLFHELVEGVGSVDAVDLVRLVSTSEIDLVRRRGMLRPLVRRRLLHLEGAYAGKELTADASLPDDVVELMLEGERSGIGADARIDFHAYLKRLQSSDPFFLDLESGTAEA